VNLLLVHNAVAQDAPPDEADVLVQAAGIRAALEGLGHAVTVFPCGLDLGELEAALAKRRPDAVFNLVESLGGHGKLIHLVPAVLEALGAPYTGCPADAVYLTSHKTLAKEWMQSAGLPTPAWVTGPAGRRGGQGSGRWIIKSVWEDASVGLDDDAVVGDQADALPPLLEARAGIFGAPWFAEEYIEGREFNLAVLDGPDGPRVLPPAEMRFVDFPAGKPRIVGYAAKWHEDSFEYSHTVRTFAFPEADRGLLEEMTRLSLDAWRIFGLRGWARVDFRVDGNGRPLILEVNVNPCLSRDAGFAAALEQAGVSFSQAIDLILATAG
jgi:D-alanine-D-alanine ligase